MDYIPKSTYTTFVECPRKMMLDRSGSIQKETNYLLKRRAIQGTKIGEMARELFAPIIKVPLKTDLASMAKITQALIASESNAIAEASFIYANLFCSVDVLKRNNDGFDLYEVKSSTSIKREHLHDLAFQTYVCELAGLKLGDSFVIHVNPDYCLDDNLNLQEFFMVENCTDRIAKYKRIVNDVVTKIADLRDIPEFVPKSECEECHYKNYCYKDLPPDSILNLYSSKSKKKWFIEGIKTLEDAVINQLNLNEIQMRQIAYQYNENAPMHVAKSELNAFMDSIKFPICFLDFETLDFVVPKFKGMRPNQKVPYQASLHILKDNDAELEHREFLMPIESDPREMMIEFLLQETGKTGSIIVYNETFEKSVLKDLANQFPNYAEEIESRIPNIVDLLDVFRGGMVYTRKMGNSFSIKNVYPAICPDKANAYKDLDSVHNGVDAMAALEMLTVDNANYETIRRNLLAYCKLDTLSMVDIYLALKELTHSTI